jgi:hypothetical protein
MKIPSRLYLMVILDAIFASMDAKEVYHQVIPCIFQYIPILDVYHMCHENGYDTQCVFHGLLALK